MYADYPLPLSHGKMLTVGLVAYMIVGRMMAYVGPGHALIGHSLITKLFVTSDILSIVTQSGGGALLAIILFLFYTL